jgi:hypothetical protein
MNRILQIVFFSLITALTACGQFSIDVAPSQVSLKSGAQQQFLVSESRAQNPNGIWTATGGTIDSNGMFTAPAVSSDQVFSVAFTDSQNLVSAFATVTVISLVDGPAELPRTVPNSSMASTPAPGKVISAPPLGLQTAINSAACGDTVQLEAGASYSGAYTLPAKPCDDGHWVVIRTAAPDSALPAEGTRINPCYAGVLSLPGRPTFSCPNSLNPPVAKIVAPKGIAALTLAAGANHYRIGPGLEITRAVGSGLNYGLIVPAGAVSNIVVDHDWIHGTAQDDTTRGIFLSGVTSAAIVDSYLNDFHCSTNGACSDAQAIAGGTGPLPQGNWKISGNFLESSAENILFGGVLKNSVTPADITITGNHLYKPLIWMPKQPGFVGGKETATAKCPQWDPTGTIGQCPFVVKNLFELKNAQRVLLEGNVLENVWPGFSQQGESILLSGLNPAPLPGAPAYSTLSIESVTLRYNRIAHTTGGMNIVNMAGQGSGTAPAAPNLPVRNVSAHDNVFDDMSRAYLNNGDGSSFNLFNVSSCPVCEPLTGISIRHNSVFSANPRMLFILGSPQPQQLDVAFVDNIVTVPAGLTVTANGTPCGNTGSTNLSRIAACLVPNYKLAGNVFIGANGAWPAGNFFPATPAAVIFANYANGNGGDYHLLPVSPFAGKGIDGKDPGADVDKVNAAILGVN